MTKPDIIEIMARASYERDLSPYGAPWSHVDKGSKAAFLADMRAAISELRGAGYMVAPVEPTEVMLSNGAASLDYPSVFMGGPSKQNQRAAERAYRAMIQAAQAPHDEA